MDTFTDDVATTPSNKDTLVFEIEKTEEQLEGENELMNDNLHNYCRPTAGCGREVFHWVVVAFALIGVFWMTRAVAPSHSKLYASVSSTAEAATISNRDLCLSQGSNRAWWAEMEKKDPNATVTASVDAGQCMGRCGTRGGGTKKGGPCNALHDKALRMCCHGDAVVAWPSPMEPGVTFADRRRQRRLNHATKMKMACVCWET